MICYLNACKCTSYRKEKLFVGFHRVLELLVTLAIIVLPCHYKLLGSHFRGENFQVQRYFTSYIRTSVCRVHILFNNNTKLHTKSAYAVCTANCNNEPPSDYLVTKIVLPN